MMAAIDLQTAVYWGQLSRCTKTSEHIAHYSCGDREAYGAVCAFAVILFLFQSAFCAAVTYWRGEFIDESGSYDAVSSGPSETIKL